MKRGDPPLRHIVHNIRFSGMSNPTRALSVTEAARHFADVVNRAFYRHETTVLVKNGMPVAFVAPMAPTGILARELAHRWPLLPRLSSADAEAFANDVAAARAELPTPADPWGVILDRAVLIAAERGRFDMTGYLTALYDEPVAIAAISASELLHGVERAIDPAVRRRRGEFVEGVLANVPVIPFGLTEAQAHARIWAVLTAGGTPIGAHDLQIAATALVAGSAVATLNRDEFSRVTGLDIAPLEPFLNG